MAVLYENEQGKRNGKPKFHILNLIFIKNAYHQIVRYLKYSMLYGQINWSSNVNIAP